MTSEQDALWAYSLIKENRILTAKLEALTARYEQLQRHFNALEDRLQNQERSNADHLSSTDTAIAQLEARDNAREKTMNGLANTMSRWRSETKTQSVVQGEAYRVERRDMDFRKGHIVAGAKKTITSHKSVAFTESEQSFLTLGSNVDSIRESEANGDQASYLPFSTLPPAAVALHRQGSLKLEKYLDYGSRHLQGLPQKYEVSKVKAYITGLNDGDRQTRIERRLDEIGWTWQNAKEELQSIIKDRERTREPRTLRVPSAEDA